MIDFKGRWSIPSTSSPSRCDSRLRATPSWRRPDGAPDAGESRPCDGFDGDTFWVIAQHGRGADYVRNIEANPRVRVKGSLSRTGWRTGTAHILDNDDPDERVRILSSGNRWRRLCLQASGAITTNPLTVRIDLDPR